jgi:PKD repeat protein
MGGGCCYRLRVRLLLWFFLSLTVSSGFALNQEAHSHRHHFRVRVVSPTTPGCGVPGLTQIILTAIGFQDGILEPDDVLIRLAPAKGSTGPSESTHPMSLTRAGHRTVRFGFVIPVSIALAKPSDYRVKVSGRYRDGRSFDTEDSANLIVEPPSIPLPVAKPGGPYNGNVGQTITFDGSQSTAPGGQTLTYAWNFGDNATGSGVSPTHAYSSAGTFTVSLTVTDTGGEANTAMTVAVVVPLPVAKPGGPYNGNVGQTITFDGSQSTAPGGQTLTYAWNFGDNTTGSGVSPTHAYSSAGTFSVSLTVTDTSGGTGTAMTSVVVNVIVPNVVGLAQSAAMAAIVGADLTVGTVTRQQSTTVPPGDIISENPLAGTSVTKGSPVNLVVSQVTGLPPDPSTVAPPVETTVATTIGSSTAFLYSGANPIQTGVAPNTIVATRAAVLRGKVMDKTNAPLPGVTITAPTKPGQPVHAACNSLNRSQSMSRTSSTFPSASRCHSGAMTRNREGGSPPTVDALSKS